MTAGLIAAGKALADLLERENTALAAMDLGAAAALYPFKDAAARALTAAQGQAGGSAATSLDADQQRQARELAARLRVLVELNRRLLERAIYVQGQLLGTIARAVVHAAPHMRTPRYGATGALAAVRGQRPVVLSARA
jgi:hypothetical protein